jgi:molybdate transport system ATP-binding protein
MASKESPRLIVDDLIVASGARPINAASDAAGLRLRLSLSIQEGLLVVMGPSGAGKSTLLSTLAGLVRPKSGRIVLDDRVLVDVAAGVWVPPHRRQVGLVFQSLALFPHLCVWKNVAFGVPADVDDRRAEALALLERLHVRSLAERAPSTLSGGEAQRVALARALAARPRLVLLDEPFSALDAPLRRELGLELRALVHEAGIPAILVTHDPDDAALGDERVLLRGGLRVEHTEPQR